MLKIVTTICIFSLISGCSMELSGDNSLAEQQPGKENCKEACLKISELKCWQEIQIQNCELDCQAEHDEGYFWNTECISGIEACDEIVSKCKSIIKRNDCG